MNPAGGLGAHGIDDGASMCKGPGHDISLQTPHRTLHNALVIRG